MRSTTKPGPRRPRDPPERLARPVRHCPVCGSAPITGQGMYACLDCGWFGVVTRRR